MTRLLSLVPQLEKLFDLEFCWARCVATAGCALQILQWVAQNLSAATDHQSVSRSQSKAREVFLSGLAMSDTLGPLASGTRPRNT